MNRSFQSVVIAFFASILLISGCSSGSSTGVSFSKEAVTEIECFAEYVSFYGDVQADFMDNGDAILIASFTGSISDFNNYDYDDWNGASNGAQKIQRLTAAEFGKKHYYQTGAKEGRQLPYGCEAFLRPHPRCFEAYLVLQGSEVVNFDFSQDHLDAIGEMNAIHGVIKNESTTAPASGYHHWIKHGRDEGRAVPTIPGLRCDGMITHQPACRPGSRFPNCDASSQDLGATGLGALLAEAAAAAQACALRGGALNTDTNQCTVPEEEAEDVRTCEFGSVKINGVPNGETC